MTRRVSAIFCVLICVSMTATAQEHSHKTVTLMQAPSISRLKVSYAVPHRATVDPSGNILVADIRAGVVFKTRPDGSTSVLADGLNQPVSVITDEVGNAYIATAGQGKTGAGRIYKVTPEGERETLHGDLTSPTDILRDDTGTFTIALGTKNQIVTVDPDGAVETLCDRIKQPSALARGRDGELFIASRKGQIYQLLANGRIQKLADDLKSPTGLAICHDGRLVVASNDLKLTVIEKGGVKSFAKVPQGTTDIAFSPRGNMVIVNKLLQSVTRVTTRTQIPCPHCDKPIPVILKKPKPSDTSF